MRVQAESLLNHTSLHVSCMVLCVCGNYKQAQKVKSRTLNHSSACGDFQGEISSVQCAVELITNKTKT